MRNNLKVAVIIGTIFPAFLYGQVMDDLFDRQEVPMNRHVEALPMPSKDDVLWNKTIYRVIDLREIPNLVAYYPILPGDGRYNLARTFFEGLRDGAFVAYGTENPNSEFRDTITYDMVKQKMGYNDQVIDQEDPETGVVTRETIPGEFKYDEVMQYWVKEVWYIDIRRGKLEVRIRGIAPIQFYTKEEDQSVQLKRRVCWFYYPEVRNWLANHEIYNPSNDSKRMTYDDWFLNRKFQSYIVKESNMYNRRISDYREGIDEREESMYIMNQILDKEQGLWEY